MIAKLNSHITIWEYSKYFASLRLCAKPSLRALRLCAKPPLRALRLCVMIISFLRPRSSLLFMDHELNNSFASPLRLCVFARNPSLRALRETIFASFAPLRDAFAASLHAFFCAHCLRATPSSQPHLGSSSHWPPRSSPRAAASPPRRLSAASHLLCHPYSAATHPHTIS